MGGAGVLAIFSGGGGKLSPNGIALSLLGVSVGLSVNGFSGGFCP